MKNFLLCRQSTGFLRYQTGFSFQKWDTEEESCPLHHLTGRYLNQTSLDAVSHRTGPAQSSVQAPKPTMSSMAASCWALRCHSNQSSSNETPSFTLVWGQGHFHKIQTQWSLCVYLGAGHILLLKVGGWYSSLPCPLWGATSEHEGYGNNSFLSRCSGLQKSFWLSDSSFPWMIQTQSRGSVKYISQNAFIFPEVTMESPVPWRQTYLFFFFLELLINVQRKDLTEFPGNWSNQLFYINWAAGIILKGVQ